MKKIVYIVGGVVGVVAIGVGFLVFSSSSVVEPLTYSETKAKTENPATCLAENTALTVNDTKALTDIQTAAMSQLTDVPAGTQVETRLTTYDGNTATGSEDYAGDHGSYNFALKKDASGIWRVTDFALCKK